MSQTRRRGPVAHRPAATINSTNPTQTLPEDGSVHLALAAGRRTRALALILRCPRCGSGHVHRAADVAALLAGEVWRRCPVLGQRYRLAPVRLLDRPAAIRAALPRQRRGDAEPASTLDGAA